MLGELNRDQIADLKGSVGREKRPNMILVQFRECVKFIHINSPGGFFSRTLFRQRWEQ